MPLVEACSLNTDQTVMGKGFKHLAVVAVGYGKHSLRCIPNDVSDHFGLVVELELSSSEISGEAGASHSTEFAAVRIVCFVDCLTESDMQSAGELIRAFICRGKLSP